MCEYICIHICVHWSYMYNMTGGIVGWGDPPVGAYDMHGPNTDYGIIQPYHGILQPAPVYSYTLQMQIHKRNMAKPNPSSLNTFAE